MLKVPTSYDPLTKLPTLRPKHKICETHYTAGCLQDSHMFLRHLLKVCSKSLTTFEELTKYNFMKSLSFALQHPDNSFQHEGGGQTIKVFNI
jgi:hypothetical protein